QHLQQAAQTPDRSLTITRVVPEPSWLGFWRRRIVTARFTRWTCQPVVVLDARGPLLRRRRRVRRRCRDVVEQERRVPAWNVVVSHRGPLDAKAFGQRRGARGPRQRALDRAVHAPRVHLSRKEVPFLVAAVAPRAW